MFTCPHCYTALANKHLHLGVYWACDTCGGRAMGLGLLRRIVGEKLVRDAWAQAMQTPVRSGRNCPACAKDMRQVVVQAGEQSLVLDLCQGCEFMWFDTNEFEAIPPPPPKPRVLGDIDESQLPLEMREKLALAKATDYADRAYAQDPMPDEGWKNLPALLGLPVEMDSSPLSHQPWMTYGVSLLIAAVSSFAFLHLQTAVDRYGMIPSQVWQREGVTLVTSFFLHGGWVHLLGNLYFLVTFGRAVEDFLGRWRWLVLLAAAALIGDFSHIAFDPHGEIPCIGASGGISGIMAFYALKFPMARLGLFLRYGYFFYRWIQMPAWGAFLVWVLFQVVGAWTQVSGYGHISSLAHLGGVVAGLVFWAVWRNLDAKPTVGGTLFKVVR